VAARYDKKTENPYHLRRLKPAKVAEVPSERMFGIHMMPESKREYVPHEVGLR
jgi:hypothetical protein